MRTRRKRFGDAVRAASWLGTGAFTAAAAGGAMWPSVLAPVTVVVAVALFGAGVISFFWSYLRVLGRSRTERISVGAVYFLSGNTAPAPVRNSLILSLVVEVVVALGAAIARPYTSLAAVTLAPVYGVALCGVWAALYGNFPPR